MAPLRLRPSDPLYIDIGRLRDRIIIQQLVTADDAGTGLPDAAWSTFAERWAYFDHVSSQDMYQSPTVTGTAQWKITLHYLEGVTSAMRVLFREQVYEIEAEPVDVQMRRRKLLLFVSLHDGGTA